MESLKMKLRIGTRGSQLALWQANHIRDRLLAECDDVDEVDFEVIKTRGDTILDRTLSKVGGKGLFITEIEDAILDNRVDLAVHSMKDMPAVLPPGLVIASIPQRANPLDAFVTPQLSTLSDWRDLPQGAVVGTSSLRRTCQLLAARPDLRVKPLRGNVDTRLRKLDDGEEGMVAIILASAGLERLGLEHRISCQFDAETMIPCRGPGSAGDRSQERQRKSSGGS
jgi:hydroxymethylbilane synthase